MRWIGFLAVLLFATRAHAMGRYVTVELVAWSADGTAALIQRYESSSGQAGHRRDFLLVTAGTKGPTVVTYTFDNTLDADTAVQHVTSATCATQAKDLARAVKARKLAITVHADACTSTRAAVTIPAATAKAVAGTWITADLDRPATKREIAAMEAKRVAVGSTGDGNVATVDGHLVIVVWGINADSSEPAHGVALSRANATYVTSDDLRR